MFCIQVAATFPAAKTAKNKTIANNKINSTSLFPISKLGKCHF